MARIVSIWFPHLAMERWRRTIIRERTPPGDDVPVVLSQNGSHGPVIHALNRAASRRGLHVGERIVDAQSIHPDLHVEPGDPEGDRLLLDRLVIWARRWGPWTTCGTTNDILLDSTGVSHLFGGEMALLRDILHRFAARDLSARIAMATTPMAAQALAKHAQNLTICTADTLVEQTAPLPVSALRLDSETKRLLDRLGLKSLGALSAMPRHALMRRFSALEPSRNPLILLDRMTGRIPDPLNAPPDPVRWLVRSRLAEPVCDPVPHLTGLAEDLCTVLKGAERGARLLRLTIYRVDGEWRAIDVATARATSESGHMLRLLTGKLDGMDPGFGFDLLTLEALRTEPSAPRQQALDDTPDPGSDVAALLDRLTARLGADKVTWTTWRESHIPERSEGRVPAIGHAPSKAPPTAGERPIRLLAPPEEIRVLYSVPEGPPAGFRWRGVVHQTARYEGPERIAPEWWQDRPGTRLRDYYKIEVTDGRRFWLYREGLGDDGRGGDPRWFLHGFFA